MHSQQLRVRTAVAVLAALSFLLMLIEINIPFLPPWLKYDPADIAALVGGFTLGPGAGGAIVLFRNLLRALLVRPEPIGLMMNTLAGASFVMVAATYYRYRLTRRSAAVALMLGGFAQILACIPAAQMALPLYGIPAEATGPLLWGAILPFNVLKVVLNGVLTFYFYKRIARHLPRIRPLPEEEPAPRTAGVPSNGAPGNGVPATETP